jgi:hypothetical protein
MTVANHIGERRVASGVRRSERPGTRPLSDTPLIDRTTFGARTWLFGELGYEALAPYHQGEAVGSSAARRPTEA